MKRIYSLGAEATEPNESTLSGASSPPPHQLRPKPVENASETKPADGEAVVGKAAAFIHLHLGEGLTAASVATAIDCPCAALDREFRARLGRTVRGFIRATAVARAAELLDAGTKVEAVVRMVGYRSRGHFYRHFKTTFGTTPGHRRIGGFGERAG